MVIMEYRTRERHSENAEWGDWAPLPTQLIFTSFYHPDEFEFRVMDYPLYPTFIFDRRSDGTK